MKFLLFAIALLNTVPANASDLAMVAFERFSFEISASTSAFDKAESMAVYLDTLSRLGSEPESIGKCAKGIFGKKSTGFCFPMVEARSGSGTGGVD